MNEVVYPQNLSQQILREGSHTSDSGKRDSSTRPDRSGLAQNDKGAFSSIHLHPWPIYDPKLLEKDEVTIVISIDGKMREVMQYQRSKIKDQKDIEMLAKESEKVKRHLEGKTVRKVVYVEGKLINFVTS